MKKRFSIVTIIIVLIALGGLVILLWPKRMQQAPSKDVEAPLGSIESSSPKRTSNDELTSKMESPGAAGNTTQKTKNDLEKTNEIIQTIESKNSPVVFYGRIIDQHNEPISGVKVHSTIRQWYVRSPITLAVGAHFIAIERESDASGRFEIIGETGDGFGVVIDSKSGYILSPKAPKGFGPNAGSFENPVIFKMWKISASEALIGGSHVFGIDSGKTYTLNLISGKKFEGEAEGDLRVSITRPLDAKPRDKFPWSFSLEVVGGGLVEANPDDEFMYVAPESGYQPKIEMQFDPNDPAWVEIIKKQFFVRSRNGQVFGRAKVEIDSIYNVHSAIQIDYAINPNGSRNLQP